MMKFNLAVIGFLFVVSLQAQIKYEREHRIKKSQFPDAGLTLINGKLKNVKRLKFYKEIDSITKSYEAKFKKNRLWYSIEFDQDGKLEDIEITIKAIDIPNESYDAVQLYLDENFKSYKIKKIQQQYVADVDEDKTLNDAFQNLLLPSLNYEIMVTGKKGNSYENFEILFDAMGAFKTIRKSLPPNYDHVLY
jgi:hypothetical protein